jgi:uncharacterized protein YecE (DUF72 family)
VQSTGRTYVGISGYNYAGWRGRFYPPELRPRDWLKYASRAFNSIELNGTFYSLKSPDVFQRWVNDTPPGFIFAIKGSRFITHNLKLARSEGALANFYASGVLALGRKTGPFLWQLPGTYRFERDRMQRFLDLLPRDAAQAERLARHHDDRLKRGALTEAVEYVEYRHALEVRHPTYFTESFFELLRSHGISFVVADTAGKFPYAETLTADFVYVRLHGSQVLYASGYTDEELDTWAARVRAWTCPPRGAARDAYVYFDNDALAHAPNDALRLAERVGVRDSGLGTGDSGLGTRDSALDDE